MGFRALPVLGPWADSNGTGPSPTPLSRVPRQLSYLELEEIVLNLLLAQVQLGGHKLLQDGSHIPSHAHVSTNVEVALLPMEHAEYLIGQLRLQDVLDVDLKV